MKNGPTTELSRGPDAGLELKEPTGIGSSDVLEGRGKSACIRDRSRIPEHGDKENGQGVNDY